MLIPEKTEEDPLSFLIEENNKAQSKKAELRDNLEELEGNQVEKDPVEDVRI